MTAKQRRKIREKEIALNSWYSCMIAMGSVPQNEDLYFQARKQFLTKHRIRKSEKIKTTCDEEFKEIKNKYIELNALQLNKIKCSSATHYIWIEAKCTLALFILLIVVVR